MTEYIQVRLYNKEPARFAEGGLSSLAETVREGGRGDDDILLHLSPEEFDVLQAQWGPADLNPVTGLPEYGWLSDKWKKVKKYGKKILKRGLITSVKNPWKALKESLADPVVQTVGPWVLNAFVPGAGAAVGSMIPGVSAAAAPVVGQAVIQGGLGAAGAAASDQDVGQGALRGALSGAVAGGLGSATGAKLGLEGSAADIVGSGLAGGIGAGVTGDDPLTGALTSGLGAASKYWGPLAQDPTGVAPPEISPSVTVGGVPQGGAAPAGGYRGWGMAQYPSGSAAGTPAPAAAAPPKTNLMDMAMKYGVPLLSAAQQAGYEDEGPPPLPEGFGDPLPQYTLDRGVTGVDDYFTYGQVGAPQQGEHLFFDQNVLPSGPPTIDPETGEPIEETAAWEPGPAATKFNRNEPFQYREGKGLSKMLQRLMLQGEGWYYDEESGMMYPPQETIYGTGEVAGPGPGFSARGGKVGYQEGGKFDYYAQNMDALRVASREGGHLYKGPGNGRSDDIEAMLSDGEYVMDAETVALLGDGSVDAGAERLDEMRANLRKHKAKKLGKGEFSHAAKHPEKYMARGGTVRRRKKKKKYEHGGTHNLAKGGNVDDLLDVMSAEMGV